MATKYTVTQLTQPYFHSFSAVYNDFRARAIKDYQFEIEPLKYEDFLEAIEKHVMECLVLLEDNVPAGFLVYTTMISESLELNLIHCVSDDDINEKRKVLLEYFMKTNETLIKNKVTTYPLLGVQKDFVKEIQAYNFKITDLMVLRFDLSKKRSNISEHLPAGYSVMSWDKRYLKKACEIIAEAFSESYDALFDPRFKTQRGVQDILNKIIKNIYGEFVEQATKILLYKRQPAGVCFVNVTGRGIANIPLIALSKAHQGKKLSAYLLSAGINDLCLIAKKYNLQEVNATTNVKNLSAINMYEHVGFAQDYTYPQAYTEI